MFLQGSQLKIRELIQKTTTSISNAKPKKFGYCLLKAVYFWPPETIKGQNMVFGLGLEACLWSLDLPPVTYYHEQSVYEEHNQDISMPTFQVLLLPPDLKQSFSFGKVTCYNLN